MASYKLPDHNSLLLPVVLSEQIIPGSFAADCGLEQPEPDSSAVRCHGCGVRLRKSVFLQHRFALFVMNESRLQPILAIIPVVSAGLYLLGFAYHQGYLDAFGIEDSLFPLATDRSLLFGFFAAINMGLVPMLYAFGAVAILFVTVVVVATISSVPRVQLLQARIIKKLRSFRNKGEASPTMSALVDKSGTLYGYVGGSFLVLFLLALVPVFASKSGKEQAQKEIEAFRAQKTNWVMLHTPLLAEPTKAKQIFCSSSHCAFWLGNESLIVRQESIERLVTYSAAAGGALRDKSALRPSP